MPSQTLDELKQTAKSIGDIHNWFLDNLYVLVGETTFPSNSNKQLNLELNTQNGFMTRAWSTHYVVVDLSLEVNYDVKHDASLAQILPATHTGKNVDFYMTQEVRLHLSEWPLATALVATHYIYTETYNTRMSWGACLSDMLDSMLMDHFPKVSMSMLCDLAKSNMLTLTENGRIDEQAVMEMIFASRDIKTIVSAPMDFA